MAARERLTLELLGEENVRPAARRARQEVQGVERATERAGTRARASGRQMASAFRPVGGEAKAAARGVAQLTGQQEKARAQASRTAVAMRNQGRTYREIGRAIGYSSSQARQFVRQHQGLERAAGRGSVGLRRMGRDAQETGKHMGGLRGRMGGLARTAAGVAAAYIGIGAARTAITTTEDLAKSTLRLTKLFTGNSKAAGQWAAVAKARTGDAGAFDMALKTLSQRLEDARRKTGTARDQFHNLGVTLPELQKGSKDLSGFLLVLADKFQHVDRGSKAWASGAALLGRGYKTLLPLLSSGRAGVQDALDLTTKYGAALDDLSTKQIQDLIKSQREMKVAGIGLQVAFTKTVAPALVAVSKGISTFVDNARKGKGVAGGLVTGFKSVVTAAKDVGQWVGNAAHNIKRFVDSSPILKAAFGPLLSLAKGGTLLKVAGGLLAVAAAYKAIKSVGRLTGISNLFGDLNKIGRGSTGRTIGQRLASGIGSGFRAARGRVTRDVDSTLDRAGRSAGRSAARTSTTSFGSTFGSSMRRQDSRVSRSMTSTVGRAGRNAGRSASRNATSATASGIGPGLRRHRGNIDKSYSKAGEGWGKAGGNSAGSHIGSSTSSTIGGSKGVGKGSKAESRGRAAFKKWGTSVGGAAALSFTGIIGGAVADAADEINKLFGGGKGSPLGQEAQELRDRGIGGYLHDTIAGHGLGDTKAAPGMKRGHHAEWRKNPDGGTSLVEVDSHGHVVKHRQHGGRVPGPDHKKDTVPAMLRGEEHVWTPEEVRGAGGHHAMVRMRKAARAGHPMAPGRTGTWAGGGHWAGWGLQHGGAVPSVRTAVARPVAMRLPSTGIASNLTAEAARGGQALGRLGGEFGKLTPRARRAATDTGKALRVELKKGTDDSTKTVRLFQRNVDRSTDRVHKDTTKRTRDLSKRSRRDFDDLKDGVQKSMRDSQRSVEVRSDKIEKTLRDTGKKVKRSVVGNFDDTADGASKNLKRLAQAADTQSTRARVSISKNTKRAAADTDTNLGRARVTGSKHMSKVASNTASSMGSMSRAVFTGTSYVGRALNAALKSFDAKQVKLSVPEPKGIKAHARGGYVRGSFRRGTRDTELVAAAPGEAFLTWEQQQEEVQPAMAYAKSMGWPGAGSLEETWARRRTPHHAERGGRMQSFATGGNVNLMGSKPGLRGYAVIGKRYGLSVTSGRRPGAVTKSGNTSMHASGDAIDVNAGSGSAMLKYARFMANRFGRGLDELIHTPLGFGIKNGQRVAPYAAADHYDHVHVGDRTPSGAAGGFVDKIPKVVVRGPNGTVKVIAQSAIDRAHKAAQAKLDKESAAFDTSSGGTDIPAGKGVVVTASTFSGSSGAGGGFGGRKVYAELSDPPSSHNWSALGHAFGQSGPLRMGTRLAIRYRGKTVTGEKRDVGAGGPGMGGHKRAIDLHTGLARLLGFGGLGLVRVAKAGRGGRVGFQTGGRYDPTATGGREQPGGPRGALFGAAHTTLNALDEKAVKRFQKFHHIKVTGLITPETLRMAERVNTTIIGYPEATDIETVRKLEKGILPEEAYQTKIEREQAGYELTERRFALTDEDLFTPEGLTRRGAETTQLTKMRQRQIRIIDRRRDRFTGQINAYKHAVRSVRQAIRHTKDPKAKDKLRKRMAGYQKKLPGLRTQRTALGGELDVARLDLQEFQKDAASELPTAPDVLEHTLGLVELGQRAGDYTEQQARDAAHAARQWALGGGFGALTDEQRLQIRADDADALKEALDANTEAQQANNDLLQQQLAELQALKNVSDSQYGQLAQAITAVTNGMIGGRVGLGFATPSRPGRVSSL